MYTLNSKDDVAGTAGAISGGIGCAYFRTDGISSAAVGTEKDGYKNFAGNARLKIAFSDALSLNLRGYYINADLDYDSFFGTPTDSTDVAKLRSEDHTSDLKSLMRISYDDFCLKTKK